MEVITAMFVVFFFSVCCCYFLHEVVAGYWLGWCHLQVSHVKIFLFAKEHENLPGPSLLVAHMISHVIQSNQVV